MPTKVIRTTDSCADAETPETLTVSLARERILASITPIRTDERLALRDALERVLATDIVSPVNVPGHTNSAMDGYAMAGSELSDQEMRDLILSGSAYAGVPYASICPPGACVRIMTGAPMPRGTDTVVMQEQAMVVNDKLIRIGSGHRRGQNVRQAGEDIARGSSVLQAGKQLMPADLGVLASLGFGEIRVRRRPRVAFFSTGDELRSIGERLGEGEVYDSNRYSLFGMLKRQGVECLDLGVVKDDPDALRQAFESAAEVADLVITSGGVSVGEADYTKTILQQLGDMRFWKIAMKPGRPLTFGKLGNALFFGLPGNPVAVMVTFYQFVLPALHTLASGKAYVPFTLRAESGCDIRKRSGRFEFIRGVMGQQQDGTLSVDSVGQQGSGILTSMSLSNCFILLDEACEGVTRGDVVTIQPFSSLI